MAILSPTIELYTPCEEFYELRIFLNVMVLGETFIEQLKP